MSRLSRKEIKRDEVLETAKSFYSYFLENTKVLVGLGAAILAIAVFIGIFLAFQSRRVEEGNRMLARAIQLSEAEIDAGKAAPDDQTNPVFADEDSRNLSAKQAFEAVSEKFGGGPLAAVAASYLGDMAAAAGDLDGASRHWQQAVDSGAKGLLIDRLRINILELRRSRGEEAAVIDELRGLLGSSETTLPGDVILHQLATTLEQAGRIDEARASYQQLVDEHETSPYVLAARQRLSSL